jgi:hypothetical protein
MLAKQLVIHVEILFAAQQLAQTHQALVLSAAVERRHVSTCSLSSCTLRQHAKTT